MAPSTAHRRRSGIPKPRRGSLYRGGEGMWSWVAHRITGVLTFFFLFAHVLDTALVRVSRRPTTRSSRPTRTRSST